jgi:class 3 adenylate cyclase
MLVLLIIIVISSLGHDMPRYCLFGDTVNVANRLQTTSEVGKIHISESTESLLNLSNQYDIKLNSNNTLLKGKDCIRSTYWLTPTLPNNIELSEIEEKIKKIVF